jgi:hypothetical protein
MRRKNYIIYLFILFSLTISNCSAKDLIINEEKSKLTYSLSEFGFVFKKKPLPMRGFLNIEKDLLNKIDLKVKFTSKNPFFRKFINYKQYPDFSFISTEKNPINFEKESFTITGDVSFHGVTKRMTIELKNASDIENYLFTGEINIKMTDFGLTPPRFLFFRVDDHIKTEVEIYSNKV